jgi:biopolymer transport protein ExbD
MAFGTQDDTDEVMNEINMTPLVDLMLVLLIIFMVTIPVMKHAIDVDLPRASSTPQSTKAEVVALTVNAQGQYFLNESALDDSALPERFKALATKDPQPELHIRGDSNVRYERVALALAAAQQSGLRKIAFITEPKAP